MLVHLYFHFDAKGWVLTMEMSNRQARRRRVVRFDEVLDDQQQENTINNFIDRAHMQAKLYRTVFSVVLIVPTPTYIFARHCRGHPKLALLSLFSLLLSVYTLRQSNQNTNMLRKLNTVLAAVIAIQAWLKMSGTWTFADAIWFLPLLASATSVVLEHWLNEIQLEINRLNQKRYDLRGV